MVTVYSGWEKQENTAYLCLSNLLCCDERYELFKAKIEEIYADLRIRTIPDPKLFAGSVGILKVGSGPVIIKMDLDPTLKTEK